jgi:hypothetical protein
MNKAALCLQRTPRLCQVSRQGATHNRGLSSRPHATSSPVRSKCRASSTSSTSTTPAFDPLKPQIATDEVGLPLQPTVLPVEIFNPPPTRITSAELQRLHRMAAIAPPVPGSQEEDEMLRGLEGLLGLMDQVKKVKLDMDLGSNEGPSETEEMQEQRKIMRKSAIRKLLVTGNYADPSDILDGSRIEEDTPQQESSEDSGTVKGKELLAWRTTPMER